MTFRRDIRQILPLLMGVATLCGCAKESPSPHFIGGEEVRGTEMSFSADMTTLTKATDLTDFKVGDKLGMWGYHLKGNEYITDESSANFFDNQLLNVVGNESGEGYHLSYYPAAFWPEEGRIRIFAYYPYNTSFVTVDSKSKVGYPSLIYKPAYYAELQYDFLVANTPEYSYGSDEGEVNSNIIRMSFRHALAKLTFSLAQDYDEAEYEGVEITIKHITLCDASYYRGRYTDSEAVEDNDIYDGTIYIKGFSWDDTSAVGAYDIKSGNYGGLYSTLPIERFDAENPKFTPLMKSVGQYQGAFMIPSQRVGTTESPILVEYQVTYGGRSFIVSKSCVLQDATTGEEGVALKRGAQTVIRFVLTPDSIESGEFSVVDWGSCESSSSVDGGSDWGATKLTVKGWNEIEVESEI